MNGLPLHFKGARILRAGFDALLSTSVPLPGGAPSLSLSTDLVLMGNSAGGLATILHADEVGSWLPKSINYRALAEVGMFVWAPTVWGVPTMPDVYRNIAAFQNISAGAPTQVDATCMQVTPPERRAECFAAQFTLPWVRCVGGRAWGCRRARHWQRRGRG